jgi:hypothetical protein
MVDAQEATARCRPTSSHSRAWLAQERNERRALRGGATGHCKAAARARMWMQVAYRKVPRRGGDTGGRGTEGRGRSARQDVDAAGVQEGAAGEQHAQRDAGRRGQRGRGRERGERGAGRGGRGSREDEQRAAHARARPARRAQVRREPERHRRLRGRRSAALGGGAAARVTDSSPCFHALSA